MQERTMTNTGEGYRFGFGGKENDNDVKGRGNSIDFGARIFDSRLGKWFAVDPGVRLYPYVSPYAYSLNSPVYMADPNGKWVKVTITKFYDTGELDGDGKPVLKKKKWFHIFKRTSEIRKDITIGEVRFLDLSSKIPEDSPNPISDPYSSEDQKKIMDNYKEQMGLYDNKEFNSENGQKTIKTTIAFAGEMKFINSTEDLEGIEELIVISSLEAINPTNGNGTHGWSISGNPSLMHIATGTILEKWGTIPHEFTHQRSGRGGEADHKDGGIMGPNHQDGRRLPNYDNAKSLKLSSKGIVIGGAGMDRIKKLEDKLDNNTLIYEYFLHTPKEFEPENQPDYYK